MDGAPLKAMFRCPQGLAMSPDGAQLLIADTLNNLIRSFGACENVPCQLGSWRGDCDVIYMGRCVPCTKSINSTITKAADPFNQDTCKWECSVGHWQYDRTACTLGDKSCARCRPCSLKLPRNASFSTNGGFEDKCQWTCNAGFELNAAGNGCNFIPLSRCFETWRVSEKGSLCAGQNFTVKGCAPNSEVPTCSALSLRQRLCCMSRGQRLCQDCVCDKRCARGHNRCDLCSRSQPLSSRHAAQLMP
jgi:hypothetical protein